MVVAFTVVSPALIRDDPHPRPGDDSGSVQVQMRNVMYHYSDSVAVHLRVVAGALVPTKAGQMPVFDDKNSFTLHISAAEIAMDTQSLANVLWAVGSGNAPALQETATASPEDKAKAQVEWVRSAYSEYTE